MPKMTMLFDSLRIITDFHGFFYMVDKHLVDLGEFS